MNKKIENIAKLEIIKERFAQRSYELIGCKEYNDKYGEYIKFKIIIDNEEITGYIPLFTSYIGLDDAIDSFIEENKFKIYDKRLKNCKNINTFINLLNYDTEINDDIFSDNYFKKCRYCNKGLINRKDINSFFGKIYYECNYCLTVLDKDNYIDYIKNRKVMKYNELYDYKMYLNMLLSYKKIDENEYNRRKEILNSYDIIK